MAFSQHLTRRQRSAGVVLAALAVAFITLDVGGGSLRSAHDGVGGAFGSLYRGTDAVIGPVRRWVQGIPGAGSAQHKIAALEQQNAALNGQLAANQAAQRDADQLKTLRRSDFTTTPARVIAIGAGEGFDWTVTLDRGTADGIKDGQTVTDGHGLAGRVLRADAATSLVVLAADPGAGVGARDLRSGEIGIATGNGPAGFIFVPLDPQARLKVGDTLETGPSSASSYVPALAVGTITKITTSADGTVKATVRPAVDATQVDVLGVIERGAK